MCVLSNSKSDDTIYLATENLNVILPLMMTLSIELLNGSTLRMSSPETLIFIESKSN